MSKIEFPAKFIREVVKGVVVAVLLTAVEAAGIIAIVFFGWFPTFTIRIVLVFDEPEPDVVTDGEVVVDIDVPALLLARTTF